MDFWRTQIATVRGYGRRLAPHKHIPYAQARRRWYAAQIRYARAQLRTDPIQAIWDRVKRGELDWPTARDLQAAIVAERAPNDIARAAERADALGLRAPEGE